MEPPGELQFLWFMEDTHSLPVDGGLMDQPNLLMDCIAVCIGARDQVAVIRDMRRLKNGANPTPDGG